MDKAKSSKGVIKVLKHEKRVSRSPPCHSMDKDKNFFKVEENDFPSLLEVQKKNPKSGKDSSTYSVSSFTYSSKLKALSTECSSQNMKFKNVNYCEPKAEFVSSEVLLKNESPINRMACGRHMTNTLQSSHVTVTKQSISAACNVPTSIKKSNSKLNASSSEGKSNKSECFSPCTNMKTTYERKSVNDNRSPKIAHGESSTFEKTWHSPKKGQHLDNSTSANAQRFSTSQSLSSPRTTNAGHSATLRSNISNNKESDRPVVNVQHKRLGEINRAPCSKTGSGQDVRLSQGNGIHSKASGNTSNKTRILSNAESQMTCSSVKPGNNKAGNQSLHAQSLTGPSETKKKKKRKSKLKRQAALQTGKILFLTPEVHSKIIGQSNNICLQKNQNILTNINDSEEYPELGLAESKTVKKSHVTTTHVHTKEENSTNLVTFESGTTKMENLLVSKDFPANDNLEGATKLEERHNDPVEKTEGEKSSIHSNNPITLSLFDMLATAKPRKKEPEKKDESMDENNVPAKNFKKEMIKRNVPQAVNPLASSKPTIKRGKEREKPKIKRPSRMRKLIVMEKQLRKETAAIMRLEAEDENQEESDEISPIFHNINEFSAHDNFETYVENLLNCVTNHEDVNETCDIHEDVNNKASELLALSCEDVNFQSTSKNQNVNEQSKLNNVLLNNVLQSVENHMTKPSNNIISDSFVNIQNDFVENPDSNLTDIEKNLQKDLVNINTVEDLKEICSSTMRNFSEKYLELKNNFNPCPIGENLEEDGEKTKTVSQIHNFTNRMQESDCKITDMTKNVISSTACNNTDVEFNCEKGSDSTETKQSSGNSDSFEKIISDFSTNSFSDQEKLKATKLMLHSRKFRQYCNHFISKEIDQAVYSLIDDLARFQDRLYQKDPVKAKIRRRLVYGIKEIKKHMKLKKVKCIIIATDIEDIKIEGGLNDSLRELISLAEAYHIPYVFSHRRFNLGKVCRKSAPVSCVGIFNYEGSEKNFKKMLELHEDSKHDYFEVTRKLASELTNDQAKELFEAEKESVLSLREASQKILREKVYFTPEGYRNYETSELLENSTSIESENSIREPPQQSDDSNLQRSDEKSPSIDKCSEVFKKLDRDENSLHTNGTDINTILVKYKVVKEG